MDGSSRFLTYEMRIDIVLEKEVIDIYGKVSKDKALFECMENMKGIIGLL